MGKKKRLNSHVEEYFLKKSGRKLMYAPVEKIPVIEVDNFPELGKMTALRFLEWVQNNPGGVISLPTGKTPEYFIKWVDFYLNNWDKKKVQAELEEVGIDPGRHPDMKSLHFVQIDEFYPIDPNQQNSFYYYIQKFYIGKFGLDPKKAMFINTNEIGTAGNLPVKEIFPDLKVDLSLRTRWPRNRLERLQKKTIELADEFCMRYEEKIRKMGGIGFFLGGIGPDGHIGFNVRGSDHFSTTRLTETNYETQAAAAVDLGGIETSRNRLVITIGLGTITYNKDAVAIIMAAGEAKAKIVADSIQSEPRIEYPASILSSLPNARFYLTRGATVNLIERRWEYLVKKEGLSSEEVERVVIDLALSRKKCLLSLNREDYSSDKAASELLRKTRLSMEEINKKVYNSITTKIKKGMETPGNQVYMHTGPHHDDIMLGYLPYIVHLVRDPSNKHYFNYMTSGFTSVTNSYLLELLLELKRWIRSRKFHRLMEEGYFDPAYIDGRIRDVNLYLDGIAENSYTTKNEATSRRLLRNLIEIYEETALEYLEDRVDELINYCRTQYPGKKDIEHVQKIKGRIREWEADLIWRYFGIKVTNVNHLRLGFYKGDIFTELPTIERDVTPTYELMKKIRPTVITVALDPEGSGPDTHYKVLQAIAEALKLYQRDHDTSNLKILGYRNVWYRFHPAEANMYVPVSLNSMAILKNSFMECFGSQRSASFPSWEYDGPFCDLAQKIQVEQYTAIKTCLGRDFFVHNEHPRLRATHGLVFMKELTPEEFYKHAQDLKRYTENL
ncbi:MAG: glucosamine-6-phosphate deaminase [Candidatus Neomarinimicrobiota bacterium]|nr:MAG: glucosamine-6-phosphate deaminase [Candidatus Neomarinimicrobiota bacterium]